MKTKLFWKITYFIFIYTKDYQTILLANYLKLPIPIVSAIKKEFIKLGILTQQSGIILTEKGNEYIENHMKIKGLNKGLTKIIMTKNYDFYSIFEKELNFLNEVFLKKEKPDLSIDQTECTIETSLKRAILALENDALFGKTIVCVGDDDLISISISVLLRKLFDSQENHTTKVTVIDFDNKILNLIKSYNLNINVVSHNLILPLSNELCGKFDVIFTDPPYSINGLKLFLCRGRFLLKNSFGRIFLSFSEKDNYSRLIMQNMFLSLNFIVNSILHGFNEYYGAEIIGNKSNLIILDAFPFHGEMINDVYDEKIYTGDLTIKEKHYLCINCKKTYILGQTQEIQFIQDLKNKKCKCGNDKFKLIKTQIKN